jgi:hypothetical protein
MAYWRESYKVLIKTALTAPLWYCAVLIRISLGHTTETLTNATCVLARILDTMHVARWLSLLYPDEQLVFLS